MHSGIIPSEQISLNCESMNLYLVLLSGKLSDLFLSVFLLFLCSFDCQIWAIFTLVLFGFEN